MIYKFLAHGHPNILGTHKTTLEFTKDKEVSLRGSCIVGVKADFDLGKLKELIKRSRNKSIAIAVQAVSKSAKIGDKIEDKIHAEINPYFNSDKDIVLRKSSFISDRTFAIKSNKSSFELKRDLISFLKKDGNKALVTIESV